MVVFFNLQSVLSLRKITKFPATYLGTGWQVFLRPFHGSVFSWEKNHLALWVTKWYLLCKRLESVNDTRDSLLSHLISAWKILQRLEKMNSHLWFSSQGPNSGSTGQLQTVVNICLLYSLQILCEVLSPVKKPVAIAAQLGVDPSSSILAIPSPPKRLEVESKFGLSDRRQWQILGVSEFSPTCIPSFLLSTFINIFTSVDYTPT